MSLTILKRVRKNLLYGLRPNEINQLYPCPNIPPKKSCGYANLKIDQHMSALGQS